MSAFGARIRAMRRRRFQSAELPSGNCEESCCPLQRHRIHCKNNPFRLCRQAGTRRTALAWLDQSIFQCFAHLKSIRPRTYLIMTAFMVTLWDQGKSRLSIRTYQWFVGDTSHLRRFQEISLIAGLTARTLDCFIA
jgi:hypothetical protein